MEHMDDLKKWIRDQEENLVKDIAALVEIPSVSLWGGEDAPYGEACRKAAEKMREIAEGYGFEAEDCGGRCLRVRCGGSGKMR